MRLFLIYHGRYPSEKAASLFAGKSAGAFADIGVEVTLLVPKRWDRSRRDAYEVFGLPRNFKTVYLSSIGPYGLPVIGRFAHRMSYSTFSLSVIIYLFFKARHIDYVYSNESLPLLVTSLFFRNTAYEVHDFPERSIHFYRALLHRVRYVVATNRWKADELYKKFSVPHEKIVVEPNAVDLAPYARAPHREEARRQLNLSEGKIVVYTGHLYSWKGVDILAVAARSLPEVNIYLVGGTEYHVREYRKKYGATSNLHIIGHRPHGEMPLWQRAADVLVLPNTAKEEISARYTSPMKLFEYMASGTPIVASDLISIREIVGGGLARLVKPDEPEDLVRGIRDALHNGGDVAIRARAWVEDHTWKKRARRILDFMFAGAAAMQETA